MSDFTVVKNRYLLFAYWDYYPVGGFHDFISQHSSKDDAIFCGKKLVDSGDDYDFYHVVDLETMQIVAES